MANYTNSAGVETSYGTYNKPLKNEIVRDPKTTWDQNMFLKVLVAQMSNQDPMNPQSDTEFIGQMAQFSSLEQMTKLTGAMTQMQAYNLVGKYVLATYDRPVTLEDGTQGTQETMVEGKVSSTYTQSGITYVTVQKLAYDKDGKPVIDPETGKQKINKYDIPMADIDQVIDPSFYGDYGEDSIAILRKLEELVDLIRAQQAGEEDTGDKGQQGEGGEENKTTPATGV